MYMIIEKTRYGIRISAGEAPKIHYIGYTRREAISKYRKDYGLQRKHFEYLGI